MDNIQICHMCYKKGYDTGCNCINLCSNCLIRIITYSQLCPKVFLNIKKKEVFYKCTTCCIPFSKDFMNNIKKNKEINNLHRIYTINNLI